MGFKKKERVQDTQEEVMTETGKVHPELPQHDLSPELVQEIQEDIKYTSMYHSVYTQTEVANSSAVALQAETMNLMFGVLAELRKLKEEIRAM